MAEWTPEIRAAFERALKTSTYKQDYGESAQVTDAWYFTPQPWKNEYDRGSKLWGFTYTVNGRHVYQFMSAVDPTISTPPTTTNAGACEIEPKRCRDCGRAMTGKHDNGLWCVECQRLRRV